jgi:hypothetical protein
MNPIATLCNELKKVFAANSTSASTTAPAPTLTEPTGDGIIDASALGGQQNGIVNQLFMIFYGIGSNNATMTIRITGWRKLGSTWIPFPLLVLTITLGTRAGITGGDVSASEVFADTIVAATAYTAAYELLSQADNTIAGIKLDIFGCQKIQVQVDVNGSTSANALYAGF